MSRNLFSLLMVLASSASAYQLKQDATGATVRWTHTVGFVVDETLNEKLGEPRALDAVFASADKFATVVPQLEVSVVAGKVNGIGYNRSQPEKNQNEIVALEEWPFDKGFIAVTVLTIDTANHVILDADIALNTEHYKFKVLGAGSNSAAFDDIQNTITHEMGHALGLAHNPEELDAVMFPSAKRGETHKRDLHDDDHAGLAALYGSITALEVEAASMTPAVGCSSSPSSQPFTMALLALVILLSLAATPKKTAAKELESKMETNIGLEWNGFLAAKAVRADDSLVTLAARVSTRKARFSRWALPALTLAALVSAPSQAADVRPKAKTQEASAVFTAGVLSVRTLPRNPKSKILFSEVELAVRGCIRGDCPKTMKVLVPGGREGNLEQVVQGRHLPEAGSVLGVTAQATGAALFQLADAEDFQAFAMGVSEESPSALQHAARTAPVLQSEK